MSKTDIPAWIKAKLFENILRETITNFKQIKDFKVFHALAPGENYATVMLKVQVDVELTTGLIQKQSFMLKIAHDSELYRNEMSKWEMFVTEAGMYRDIVPEFIELYAKAGLDVEFGAKSYELPVDEEYILLEDLSMRGFRNVKRQDCLDLVHCKAVLKKLAQFHAVSAVRVEEKGMFEKSYLHGFLIEERKDFCEKFFVTTLPYIIRATKKLENNQDLYEQLTKFSNHATDKLFELCAMNKNDFNVLNHGDCWANNIMFKYDADGKLKETFFVDLQMPRYGSPAQDLLYFILSSAHIDIKIHQFDYMIQYYYGHLIEHLKLLNYTKPLPTLRDIHKALIKVGMWGLVAVMGVMSAVLCEPTDTANIDNFVGTSEEGDKFKQLLYSNDRYIEHLTIVLPWLYNRGVFEC